LKKGLDRLAFICYNKDGGGGEWPDRLVITNRGLDPPAPVDNFVDKLWINLWIKMLDNPGTLCYTLITVREEPTGRKEGRSRK
jgi:hypothetical protein